MKPAFLSHVLTGFASLMVCAGASAQTAVIPASTADQTALVNDYITGAKKVNGANAAVIQFAAGNHYFGDIIHVTRKVTINAQANAKLLKTNTSTVPVIVIEDVANGCTMDSLYIDGANRPEPCMNVLSNNNKIINCTFRNSGNTGLLFDHCSGNRAEGCKAYYNYMAGISQKFATGQTIINCQPYDNGAEGLTIDGTSNSCTVTGNWIHNNNWASPRRGVGGIGIDNSDNANIYNNTIDYNGQNGITIQNNDGDSDGLNIHDNPNISFNQFYPCKFINLKGQSLPFTFANNNCVGNGSGQGVP